VLAFVVIYRIGTHAPVVETTAIFIVAALTDLFDGIIARRHGLVSKFGARADMIADRCLWAGTALAILWVLGGEGSLGVAGILQLCAIMTREIVSTPFAVVAVIRGRAFPKARYVGKLTTFLQGMALPALLLSIYFPVWAWLSIPLSTVLFVTGLCAAWRYIHDVEP